MGDVEVECAWCGEKFALCGPCWRGQRYCPAPCASLARRAQQRRARRVHQTSDEGREDHKERNRDYRRRRREQRMRVMDTASANLPEESTMCLPADTGAQEASGELDSRNSDSVEVGDPDPDCCGARCLMVERAG